MKKWSRKKSILAGTLGALLIVCIILYLKLVPGIPFLLTYLDKKVDDSAFTIEQASLVDGDRTIPATLYLPANPSGRKIILIHGVHYGGIKEKRMVSLAKILAARGHLVFTPEIEDLKRYNIVERAMDDMEVAARWFIDDSGHVAKGEKIAWWGISFSGGLGLALLASNPLAERVSGAFSFGGHGDLDKTISYLMDGKMEGRPDIPPHAYGQAVLVWRYADRLVPADQVEPLRQVTMDYLNGRSEEVRTGAKTLPPDSAAILKLIRSSNVAELGTLLAKKVGTPVTSRRMSPTRLPPPTFPVFILHGSTDNVIPPAELARLESWARKGDAGVHALETDLIRHVDVEGERSLEDVGPYLDMILFWSALLRN